MADTDVNYDLFALFSSDDRDFLVRNNGDQVKISSLYGQVVGIYFSSQWCDNCRRFNPELVQVYQEVASNGGFEVVFVSYDEDEMSFNEFFSEMPWLAVPFSDPNTTKQLKEAFDLRGIPYLVLIDLNGKVSTENGTEFVIEHGVNGYPFTGERVEFLREETKRNQTLSSLLASRSRDYLLAKKGKPVPISELEGKTVALYFEGRHYYPSAEFTATLVRVYTALKERGAEFEVVLVPIDDEEEEFNLGLETIPWLTFPYKDFTCQTLVWYFELQTIPTLVIIGPDGKTVSTNGTELVEEHGVEAYPFTPERVKELDEIKREKEESQTLESLLVYRDEDFVIRKDSSKVPVSELVGKNILLYFSAHWNIPGRAFTTKLIDIYSEIKEKDEAFEVIFISSDSDQSSFEEHFSEMPWLALPYDDERKKTLDRIFKIDGIPTAIAIGPTGRTVTKQALDLIGSHGAKAYPFTEEQLKRLEEEEEEMVKRWPEKLRHELHYEHEIVLVRRGGYYCDGCAGSGTGWSFYCEVCDFDLHPKCALKKSKEVVKDETMAYQEDEPQCSYSV